MADSNETFIIDEETRNKLARMAQMQYLGSPTTPNFMDEVNMLHQKFALLSHWMSDYEEKLAEIKVLVRVILVTCIFLGTITIAGGLYGRL